MLVTKVKAINQWMECKSCKLQQVKSITPRKPDDRISVHCRGHTLKKFGFTRTEKFRAYAAVSRVCLRRTKTFGIRDDSRDCRAVETP